MNRLDRNDSLALMRILTAVVRSTSTTAIRLARVSLRNDRQFDEFQRTLRKEEADAKATCLKACKDFGFVDGAVDMEDLKHMR